MARKYPALTFGMLPTALINCTLGTDLAPGIARLSETAHRHVAVDHPDDYLLCLTHVAATVAAPAYIGQAPRHGRNIELLRRIPGGAGAAVLVAVNLTCDAEGEYRITSFYLVTEAEVQSKRNRGHIRVAVK